MRALIVEDEPLAARNLRQLLGDLAPDIEAEGPYSTIAATLERLRDGARPDLVFMDVELEDGICFELFDAYPLTAPVIFTTAYDRFALRAFEVFGIDYLLKPIRPSRFTLAIGKWRRLHAAGHPIETPTPSLTAAYFQQTYRSRFLVAHGESLVSVGVGDIAFFQKELVVRLVTLAGARFVLSHSLDDLEKMLDPGCFFRANRQTLVNYAAIRRIGRAPKGKLIVETNPPPIADIVVSQERAAALRTWLDR